MAVSLTLFAVLVPSACSTSVSGGGYSHSCANILVDTSYGRGTIQQPYSQGYIQWGIQPKVEYNTITVDVLINDKWLYDHKVQTYDPHGSINPAYFNPGDHIKVTGQAVDTQGTLYFELMCYTL